MEIYIAGPTGAGAEDSGFQTLLAAWTVRRSLQNWPSVWCTGLFVAASVLIVCKFRFGHFVQQAVADRPDDHFLLGLGLKFSLDAVYGVTNSQWPFASDLCNLGVGQALREKCEYLSLPGCQAHCGRRGSPLR